MLEGIVEGFAVALSWENLLFVSLGVLIGTVVGLLPGLGPTAGVSLLLPISFGLSPATAIIFLAGIYYGSMYGGRIPAILLNMPGDASSVVTTFDGYPLRKAGRAGPALSITAIGSFIGASIAIVGLTLLAPIVASFASRIGPPELFLLTLMGLFLVAVIGGGSKIRAFALAALGAVIGIVGVDPVSGEQRLTFGNLDLAGGISIVAVAVGLFGISEVLYAIDTRIHEGPVDTKIGRLLPTMQDWVQSRWAMLRASVVGFLIGVVPGGGGTVSSIVAYGLEKKISKHPERFGNGAVEGLAATETADNASSNASFIPLLTLGLPPNSVLAVLFGALLMHNVVPGPDLINQHPDIFWGVIASMYIGNIILLVLNLPLIGVFVQILRIPVSLLNAVIIIVAFAGLYSISNRIFDILVAIAFGVLGYILKKMRFNLAPLILAFILAPMMEVYFRRSMIMSNGQMSIFVERPFSILFGVTILVLLVAFSSSSIRNLWQSSSIGTRKNLTKNRTRAEEENLLN